MKEVEWGELGEQKGEGNEVFKTVNGSINELRVLNLREDDRRAYKKKNGPKRNRFEQVEPNAGKILVITPRSRTLLSSRIRCARETARLGGPQV